MKRVQSTRPPLRRRWRFGALRWRVRDVSGPVRQTMWAPLSLRWLRNAVARPPGTTVRVPAPAGALHLHLHRHIRWHGAGPVPLPADRQGAPDPCQDTPAVARFVNRRARVAAPWTPAAGAARQSRASGDTTAHRPPTVAAVPVPRVAHANWWRATAGRLSRLRLPPVAGQPMAAGPRAKSTGRMQPAERQPWPAPARTPPFIVESSPSPMLIRLPRSLPAPPSWAQRHAPSRPHSGVPGRVQAFVPVAGPLVIAALAARQRQVPESTARWARRAAGTRGAPAPAWHRPGRAGPAVPVRQAAGSLSLQQPAELVWPASPAGAALPRAAAPVTPVAAASLTPARTAPGAADAARGAFFGEAPVRVATLDPAVANRLVDDVMRRIDHRARIARERRGQRGAP